MLEDQVRYTVVFNNPTEKPKRSIAKCGSAGLAELYRDNPSVEKLDQLVQVCQGRGHESRLRELLAVLAGEETDLELRARIYMCMGQSAGRSRRLDSAIEFYTQAFALEPCDPFTAYFTHNNLAFCLNLAGEYARAEALLRVALKIDPTRFNAHKNMGISLAAQGDYLSAVCAWVCATRANAADERAHEMLERLVEQRPWLRRRIPQLDGWLQECRMAVEFARKMYDLLRCAESGRAGARRQVTAVTAKSKHVF